MRTILRAEDVVRLLHQQVAKAGGQSAWARNTGIHRSLINKVLRGQMPPAKSIIDALGLEVVYLPKESGGD
jgi:DNA-binding phage protein